jgi:DNA-binding transcriptional LysR family regulator
MEASVSGFLAGGMAAPLNDRIERLNEGDGRSGTHYGQLNRGGIRQRFTMAVHKRSAGLDWEDVRCFATLARHGTLAATARTLKVTHATVARRLSNLEATLGRPLFARHRAGYRLNAAGAAALGEAAQMELAAGALDAARDAHQAARTRGIAGQVRITVARVFADGFLAERLGALTRQHPALELEIVATSRNPSLARREAEIALRLARPAAGELVARRLATLDYGFYVSPDYQRRIECGEPPVFIAFDDAGDHVPEAAWARQFFSGRQVAVRANSQGAQAAAARGGAGVALLPGLLARALGGLERVEFDAEPPARELWLLMRPDVARLARVRVVVDHLIELFGDP